MSYATDAERWRWWMTSLLALVIWREARGESREAQIAVAASIKNRVDRPSWWGTDYVSVISRKWQYSSMTDPHDAQLTMWPKPDDAAMIECLEIADGVMCGQLMTTMPGADSYYDDSIPAPKWTDAAHYVGKIGRLNFYNMDHDHEMPQGIEHA